MNRRAFIAGMGGVIASPPSVCVAQNPFDGDQLFPWVIWTSIPSITLMSNPSDSRVPLVYEAVSFWNATLSQIGTSFRLGAIATSDTTIPSRELAPPYVLGPGLGWRQEMSTRLMRLDSNLIVVLSDIEGAFGMPYASLQKVLIAIGGGPDYPNRNLVRNTIAHEFGHAIGLNHNNESGALMCGGKAKCAYAGVDSGFGPLTRFERARLREIYPASWRNDV